MKWYDFTIILQLTENPLPQIKGSRSAPPRLRDPREPHGSYTDETLPRERIIYTSHYSLYRGNGRWRRCKRPLCRADAVAGREAGGAPAGGGPAAAREAAARDRRRADGDHEKQLIHILLGVVPSDGPHQKTGAVTATSQRAQRKRPLRRPRADVRRIVLAAPAIGIGLGSLKATSRHDRGTSSRPRGRLRAPERRRDE
ncbi:hypothetical protein EVAR_153_1 [Eumeta japonica]|uniref:Uncharacterized protein n=1 Tax=Eumeta variegata TaxID=151549 RepID=A0A4C1S8J2_EUMVA|nr:hypothetical protein EVAR_153_1 [Eumeta japonica]